MSEGKEDLEWGDMAKMAFDILLCCAEKAKTGKVLKLVSLGVLVLLGDCRDIPRDWGS